MDGLSCVFRSATGLESDRAPGGGDRIRTDDRLVANQVLYQLSYAPTRALGSQAPGETRSSAVLCTQVSQSNGVHAPMASELVGLAGVEPATSRLSGERSNQLSYRPG